MEKATFAAGCFWGVEVTFRNVEGVVDTRVGYTGGRLENPTYQQVCTGMTGHAEAVEVTFDPQKVTYEQLLDVFWATHNPTTRNRQGPDIGPQYRSAIFFHSPEQEQAATASIQRLTRERRFPKPIVTEEYHQQYLVKRGMASCRI
jgi:peptide-methionine (S)-S-oxide reductase